ncbi:hypothetical protein ABPG74_003924 [Tetrahymena malaccensis]
MLRKFVYGVGLLQIGYVGYNASDYIYRYGLHKNCDLKQMYPQEYALVTGASQGLGLGYAEELAKRGYNVILASRTHKNLEEVAQKLQQKYTNVKIDYRVLNLENEDPQSYEAFFSQLKKDFDNKIGIFINNAAAFEKDYFINLTPQQIKSVIDTNVLGQTFIIQQELKYAIQNSQNGKQKTLLINVGSQKTHRGGTQEANVYYATKQYMNHLTSCLRDQYKTIDPNIQIVNNSPGYIDSPMLSSFYPDFAKTFGANFLDTPQKIAKQTLDQIDADPAVINGSDKQAFGNVLLSLQAKYQNLFK